MKIILPSFLMLMMNNNSLMYTFFLLFFILLMLPKISFPSSILNSLSLLDNLSLMMILLTMISIMLIMLSSNIFKEINSLMSPILIILLMTFMFMNLFYFYILFELVLIPTMLLITKSGKQPERLQAGMYLILYTIVASLPLLCSILFFMNNTYFIFSFYSLYKFKISIIIMMAFLVKMPMFFTHLWLPKAHVEAPLEGSMILAAVLLKLGGYGLIRIIPLCIMKNNMTNILIISVSLMGASMTSLNCIRQKDTKSLIAYSSVAHMALTLASMFTLNTFGLTGAIFMMIAHGLSSSALFLLANDLYLKSHSRNILLMKGMTLMIPNMSLWWFIFLTVNISAPPSINTLSEIFIMTSVMSWNLWTTIPIMIASFLAASFSLSMYINMFHNLNEMNFSKTSKQKIFLILSTHLIPIILLLMKSESMTMN